ncbi:16376_t:CDS:2, partial [Gigaspora margarita]
KFIRAKSVKEMQQIDIDDVQNINALSVAEKLAEITQPFVLLISSVFVIVSEAVKIYENAKHNKNICTSLLVRINIAKTNVEILQLQPRIYDHKAFYRFVEKKYAFANSVQETFTKLISEFDKSIDDLHLTITISNEQQRKLDQENLNFPGNNCWRCYRLEITDQHEVQIINKKVDYLIHDPNNTISLKAVKINPKELDNLPQKETILTKKSVVKKLYRGNDVACKFTYILDNGTSESQKIQAQLVILGKLKEFPNILRFYGLSNLNDNQVMVFEWANKGNLKDGNYAAAFKKFKTAENYSANSKYKELAKMYLAHYKDGQLIKDYEVVQSNSKYKQNNKYITSSKLNEKSLIFDIIKCSENINTSDYKIETQLYYKDLYKKLSKSYSLLLKDIRAKKIIF